tara:strand:- start:285 stop:1082 length:798 start_codon:yes stop_codon:yes gene_type:complete
MAKVLELFSGTRSIGKVCDQLGWESVSVDLIMEADHKVNIMDFDYKQYDKDYFDIIWASPPCTEYSYLQNCWLGRMRKGELYTKEIMENDMIEADKLVEKTLEIIDYFNPFNWFIENPKGRLKDRIIMKDIPFYIVDYCKYSDWGYKKTTYIWTNKKDWIALRCKNDCNNMIDKQHKKVLGNGYEMVDGKKVLCNTKEKRQQLHKARMGTSKTIMDGDKLIRVNSQELRIKYKDYKNINKSNNSETTLHDRYRIPEDLILSLFCD